MNASGLLLAGVGLLVLFLVTLGFALNVLDKLLDSRDREAIRARAEGFWFRTASLELHEQFQRALRSRYSQMRRLQPTFVKFFLVIAFFLALVGGFWGASSTPAEIKEFQKSWINWNLDIRYGYYFVIDVTPLEDEPEFGNSGDKCTIGSGFNELQSVNDLAAIKASLTKFLDENESNALEMRVFNSVVNALVPLLLALPLTIGLIVSFNLTLWLLSRFTQSRLGALLIVVADLLLALLMPTVVSGVLLSLPVFAVVFLVDALPDYTLFQHPTWTTLAVSSICVILGASLSTPVIVALFVKEFSIALIGPSYVISTIGGFAYNNAKALFVDLGRILRFDIAIEPAETLINYAIGLDLLFSLFYIVPCLSLVLMERNAFTRRIFLNVIQWIAEHPKGPLIALEEGVTAFAKYLIGVVKH